jgi:hypothetical protein
MDAQKTSNFAATRKSIANRWTILLVVSLLATFLWLVLNTGDSDDPAYGGKKLSQWLVEVDYGQPEATRKAAQEAIQHIGTNALPLLMKQFQSTGSRFQYYLNMVFAKIPRFKFRFATLDDRIRQASWGIDALGPIAKPAIPELRGLLLSNPGYVPSALAGIGPDAVPALQDCLTNDTFFYIPGNTIGAIQNAISREKLAASYVAVFLPKIQRWAASTNSHAAWYATNFLYQFSPASLTNVRGNP